MKQSWYAALGVILAGAATATAQPQPPPIPGGGGYTRPPAFSPYLNLVRSGTSPGINYYGLVRPQMQFQQSIQNLANDVSLNQQAIGNLAATGNAQMATGHMTQFMNLGGIFLNTNGGGLLAAGAGFGGAGGTYGGASGGTYGSTFGGGMTNTSRVGGGTGGAPPRKR